MCSYPSPNSCVERNFEVVFTRGCSIKLARTPIKALGALYRVEESAIEMAKSCSGTR